ncbi:MAG: hypothetical protein KC646_05750 [Candidatus Cloacimonetes bacterium]|nr:hypothetical protein [Candidatus Cloacimonadota bacterium]
MKSIAQMSRLELASYISSTLLANGIDVVLSGGSCVSIYSENKYVSMDLDFINNDVFVNRKKIIQIMKGIGFFEKNRYFKHPDTELLVEFPPGPLGVGEEPVKQIDEIKTEVGTLRIISPTDCVKDRLTWYYHDQDLQCLEQAILVALNNEIDLKEVKRWSKSEGKLKEFELIKSRLHP